MKQKIQLLFFICISFLFAGCNQEDYGNIEDMPDDTPIPVNLNVAKGVSTRVLDNGYNWNEGDTIGIFMYNNQKILSAESILEGADNLKFHYFQYHANFRQSSLIHGDTLYFPADRQQKVNIIGYYPYKFPITDYTYPIDVTSQTIPLNRMNVLDVMYSNDATDIPRSRDSLYITFRHIMNKMEVELISGEGGPIVDHATVRITGVHRTANLNLVTGTIHGLGSRGDIVLTRMNPIKRRVFLIPQPASSVKLVITLANNQGEFEYSFPSNTVFREGIYSQYNITVNKTGIEVTENTITDWYGKNDPPIEKTFRKYQIGDYYPDPADPTTAIGMVYEITDGIGYHGKIADLQFIQRYGVRWGDPTVDESAAAVVGIRDVNDGQSGTYNLIAMRKDQPGFADTYSAFNYIYQTKNGGELNGIWYLPAREELMSLLTNFDLWRARVEEAGYVSPPDQIYVALSEYNQKKSYEVQSTNFGTLYDKNEENWNLCVVAVARF